MENSKFIYVSYIRTPPEKLWQALTEPQLTRQYWFGAWQESEWKTGAPWRIMIPDGRVADSGEILEIEPPRRLLISWRNEFRPELRAEGHSRLKYDIETVGKSVKLTITHAMDKPNSKFIEAVSEGWPHVLSSLKSLLETGEALDETHNWPSELQE